MTNLPHRIFFALVLAGQLFALAAPRLLPLSDLGLRAPGVLFTAVGLAACVPLTLLVAQKAVGRHGLWAGLFGISVATLGLSVLNGLPRLYDLPSGPPMALVALSLTMQALATWGLFVYTFGSPHLWPGTPPTEAKAPATE